MLFTRLLIALCVLGSFLSQPTFAQEQVVAFAIHTAEDFLDALSLQGSRLLLIHEPLHVEGQVIVNTEGSSQEQLLSILVC